MASILIVEGDSSVQNMLARACENSGHAVARATNGSSSIRLLDEIRPEITIIDEALPDISGLEVLEHISLVGIETNAVIITGRRSTRCAVEAIRLGAREVVEKPFAIEDLLAIVAALAPFDPRRERAPRLTDHAALRVVRIVVKIVESRGDPTTVKAWA